MQCPTEPTAVVSKVPVTLGGSVRFRGEARNNLDFLDTTTDSARFGLMRFRLDFAFRPRSDLFIQPQASRVWGKNEILNSGITGASVTGTSTTTSGGVQDSRMDLHQGYLAYKASDRVEVTLGRQMLTYGDELLIGPLESMASG